MFVAAQRVDCQSKTKTALREPAKAGFRRAVGAEIQRLNIYVGAHLICPIFCQHLAMMATIDIGFGIDVN
jgi:hypothetical protein